MAGRKREGPAERTGRRQQGRSGHDQGVGADAGGHGQHQARQERPVLQRREEGRGREGHRREIRERQRSVPPDFRRGGGEQRGQERGQPDDVAPQKPVQDEQRAGEVDDVDHLAGRAAGPAGERQREWKERRIGEVAVPPDAVQAVDAQVEPPFRHDPAGPAVVRVGVEGGDRHGQRLERGRGHDQNEDDEQQTLRRAPLLRRRPAVRPRPCPSSQDQGGQNAGRQQRPDGGGLEWQAGEGRQEEERGGPAGARQEAGAGPQGRMEFGAEAAERPPAGQAEEDVRAEPDQDAHRDSPGGTISSTPFRMPATESGGCPASSRPQPSWTSTKSARPATAGPVSFRVTSRLG